MRLRWWTTSEHFGEKYVKALLYRLKYEPKRKKRRRQFCRNWDFTVTKRAQNYINNSLVVQTSPLTIRDCWWRHIRLDPRNSARLGSSWRNVHLKRCKKWEIQVGLMRVRGSERRWCSTILRKAIISYDVKFNDVLTLWSMLAEVRLSSSIEIKTFSSSK